MTQSANPLFDTAKFYDCGDPEELSHESAEEAITSHFEVTWESVEETQEQQAERICPLTVNAFVPKAMDPAWLDSAVDRMLEGFIENFEEEYGGPDGDCPPWDIETGKAYQTALLRMMTKFTKKSVVWQCDQVGEREFSAEECLEIIK